MKIQPTNQFKTMQTAMNYLFCRQYHKGHIDALTNIIFSNQEKGSNFCCFPRNLFLKLKKIKCIEFLEVFLHSLTQE